MSKNQLPNQKKWNHSVRPALKTLRQVFILLVFMSSMLGMPPLGQPPGNALAYHPPETAQVSDVSLNAPDALTCESFDSYTPGSRIGLYSGWFDDGSGPLVTAGIGVAGSVGLATDNNIFNRTATLHSFNWNAADFQKIILQGDFQTSSTGTFDDDRLSWTIDAASTSSNNQFGVQLDPASIVTYWSNVIGGSKIYSPIAQLSSLPINTWYRFHAEITKLAATSARIDVTLTQLDGSGNPTGAPITGSIADTSGLSAGQTPAAGYFTPTTMVPSFKNYNTISGAEDNICYEVVTSAPTPAITITGAPLSAFSSAVGTPSAEQSYSVAGTNLTDPIVITPPADFEISLTSGGGWIANPSSISLTPTGGTVASTTIYVRFNRATEGASSGNITHTSTGATQKDMAVSGTAVQYYTLTINSESHGTVTLNPNGGSYASGTTVTLTPVPNTGYAFDSWSGTNAFDIIDTGGVYTIVMNENKSVTATFVETQLVCEDFNALAVGTRIGTVTGWTDSASSSPQIIAAPGGVASTQGLGTGSSIFNWSAHPFLWTDSDLSGVTLQMDFQANASGAFDDDRLAWMTQNTPANSEYNFGIQLDPDTDGTACPTGQNIETYWRNPAFSTTTRIETTIACLPTLTANGWYRAQLVATKLTNTSARLDVTLTALNTSGVPGAIVASGTVADTSTWSGGEAPAGYFSPSGTSTALYLSYKNHTGTTGNADNTCYQIVPTAPAGPTITTSGTLAAFNSAAGTPSAEQSYTVAGTNLTDAIVITAPTDFQISTVSGGGFGSTVSLTPSSGTVASTPIYVRLNPATATTYSANITHTSTGATQKDVAVSGSSIPAITATSSMSAFSAPVGVNSAEQTYTVSGLNLIADIAIATPADFEISTSSGAGFGSSLSLTPTNGVVSTTTIYVRFLRSSAGTSAGNITQDSSGATQKTIAVSGTAGTPTLTVTSSMTAFGSTVGNNSAEQTYTIAGAYLKGDVTVTAPADFQISKTTATGFSSSLTFSPANNTLATSTVYVRFNRSTAGSSSGNITHTSLDAATQNVPVSGTATVAPTTVTFQEGVSSYAGNVDTTIKYNTPGASYGAQAYFEWDTQETAGSDTPEISLLQFTNIFGIRAGQIPLGSTITSATLRYRVYSGPNSMGNTANVHEPLVSWDEATTYNTFGEDAGVQFDEYNSTLVATATAAAINTDYTIDVTASLQRWSAGTANYGWVFLAGGTDGVEVHSSETATVAYRPLLTVTYIPLTEPTITTGGTLTAFVTPVGTPSTAQTYTVAGSNLSADISLTAPAGFEISSDNGSTYHASLTLPQSGGSVATTTIYVRLTGASEGTFNGNLVHTSSGAAEVDIAVSGTVAVFYTLTAGNDGNGTVTLNPTGGSYASGTTVTLTPAPNTGYAFDSWSGTNAGDIIDTGGVYTIVMNGNKSVTANFIELQLVCETFNSFTPGARIGTYSGWFSDGNGPLVSSSIGVANSIGLDSGSAIFNWTAHPFDWNAADFSAITFQADFKTYTDGRFDDDRIGWTITSNSLDSLTSSASSWITQMAVSRHTGVTAVAAGYR